MKRTDGQKRLSARLTHRKAFTLVELLVVIAIIGILFVVLISKVDFATEKAKATGVQTDFRSYQLAIETVARENAGLSTLVDDDASGEEKYAALEAALNKNLDPKLRVEIDADGKISTDAKDPWKEEYTGQYLAPDADGTVKDRGAIVMYCKGSNLKLGTTSETVNGVVNVTIESGKEAEGADDYAISTIYTYVNGYGEIKTTTEGFSNNIGGNSVNNDNSEPSNKLEKVEIWIIIDGSPMNYEDMAAEEGGTLNIHLVNELPDTLIPLDMENMIMNAYVLESTGVAYTNIDGSVLTLGQMMTNQDGFDHGWTDDINSETENGVYCVRVEVIEVIEIWMVDSGEAINFTDLAAENNATINTHLVDTLPDTMIPLDMENGVMDAYILKSTGIIYVNVDGTVMTFGQLIADGAAEGTAFDKGWSEDIYSETEDGFYCVRVDASEMVETVEIWIVGKDGNINKAESFFGADDSGFETELVDELPAVENSIQSGLKDSDVLHLYIIKSTGVAWLNLNGQFVTFGTVIAAFGSIGGTGEEIEDLDKGWSENIYAETEIGIYCVRTYRKPGQSSVLVDLGDTLTWDGNCETFTGVKTDALSANGATIQYVKLSDSVPTAAEIGSNATIEYMNVTGSTVSATVSAILNNDNGSISIGDGNFYTVFIIPTDNFVDDGMLFPEAGVYFAWLGNDSMQLYNMSFTIPGYNFTIWQ